MTRIRLLTYAINGRGCAVHFTLARNLILCCREELMVSSTLPINQISCYMKGFNELHHSNQGILMLVVINKIVYATFTLPFNQILFCYNKRFDYDIRHSTQRI